MGQIYRWNELLINERLNDLQSVMNKKHLARKENAIRNSIEIYLDLLSLLYENKERKLLVEPERIDTNISLEQKLINFHKKAKDSYYLFNQSFNDFINEMAKLPIVLPDEITNLCEEEHTVVEHIKDFYKYIDSGFFNSYNHVIENINPNLINFSYNDDFVYGSCYFDEYNRIPYVYIYRNETLMDSFSLAHENGHVFELVLGGKCNIWPLLTSEVNSYLMEMLLAEYHYQNNYHTEQTRNIMLFNYCDIIEKAIVISGQIELFSELDKARSISDFASEIEQDDRLLKILNIDLNLLHTYIYIFSFAIATEIINEYKNNSKKTLINIKAILKDRNYFERKNSFIDVNSESLVKNLRERQKIHII